MRYSEYILKGVSPTPSTNAAGMWDGKKVIPVKTRAGMVRAVVIRVVLERAAFGNHLICLSLYIKALVRNANAETNLTAIQNWADLLVEFGVTNAGIAALAKVCMKSMRPIERKAALRKSACRSLDWLYVYHPTPNMDRETMILKNSEIL
jgi:hypothetical protein